MSYAITYVYLACLILSVVGATLVLVATPRQPVRRALFALLLVSAAWSLADFLTNQATTADQMRLLAYLFVPVWVLVPYLVARCAMVYVNRRLAWWRELLLLAPAGGLAALMWSGHLFVDFSPAGQLGPFFVSHPSGWISLVVVYFLGAIGLAVTILLREARRSGQAAYRRAWRFVVLVVVPICLVALPANGSLSLLGISTPFVGSIAMSLVCGVVVVGMLRYELLAPPRVAASRAARSEGRYRALVEASPDSIAVLDLRGQVLVVNQRAAELFGYGTPEELMAAMPSAFAAVEESQRTRLQAAFAELSAVGHVRDVQWEIIRRDGTLVPVEASGAVLQNQDGQPEGLVVVGRDISARQRAEQERAQLQAQIQRSQKLESMGVLAGGVAHDFNNLLVGILGHANLARQELPPTAPLYDRLSRIETAATRAAALTRQMLDYSGRGKLAVEPVSLSSLTHEMIALLEVSICKKIAISLDIPVELPAILGDAGQLQQVVMNLLTNAAEAIGDAPGKITISAVQLEIAAGELFDHRTGGPVAAGCYLGLTVSDTGAGMSAEVKSRIWDPFFTTKFAGRGLGLAVVAGIVQAHDGVVVVDSTAGRGTAVQIILPVPADLVAARARRLTPPPPARATWRGQGKVLVVDDEELVREVARLSLDQVGYTVLTAADGQQGLEMLAAHREEVLAVVLDLTMPRMDGREAFAAMRALVPDLPVIVISGYSRDDVTTRLGEMSSSAGFLQKPFNPTELVGLLQAIEEGRRVQRA